MRRATTLILAAAALAVPAVSASASDRAPNANGGKSDIAEACASLKKADRQAFRATYGKHPMRACIKGEEPVADETTPREFRNAAKDCRAEREADVDAFKETYGKNRNGRNAFGKCVSTTLAEEDEPAAS